MKKYFALYLAPVSVIAHWMSNTPEAEKKASMDEWGKWMKQHEGSFADTGAPVGKTKLVLSQGVYDAKNNVTGYSVVEAQSHEAAAKLFEGHPQLKIPGGSIEIMEVMQMSDL